jgi:hypothetical protein
VKSVCAILNLKEKIMLQRFIPSSTDFIKRSTMFGIFVYTVTTAKDLYDNGGSVPSRGVVLPSASSRQQQQQQS